MFSILTWTCVIFIVAYFIIQWPKSANKLKSIAGIVLAFIPLVNIVVAIAILVQLWNKHGEKIKAQIFR